MSQELLLSGSDRVIQDGQLIQPDPRLERWSHDTCECVCGLGRLSGAALALWAPAADRFQILGFHAVGRHELVDTVFGADGVRVALDSLEHDGFAQSADGTLLAAPAPAGPWRAVLIGWREPDSWPYDDCLAEVVQATARIAGLSLGDRLRIAEDERFRADRARTELLCSIHADVVQRMFGVSLALGQSGPMEDELRQICATEAERALSDLREILRSPVEAVGVPVGDLEEALEELAAQGVIVDVDDEALSAAPGQKAIARSVLEEAVRNARKHAAPRSIHVVLRESGGLLQMSVCNDGLRRERHGSARRRGVGLQLAVTEAAQGGGILEYGPEGPGRWGVRLVLPMEERDEHDSARGLAGCSAG